jgi:YD repeat-containing protein
MGTVQGSITNADGRVLSFSFDTTRLWLSITDADGSALGFEVPPGAPQCQAILNTIRNGMKQLYPSVS